MTEKKAPGRTPHRGEGRKNPGKRRGEREHRQKTTREEKKKSTENTPRGEDDTKDTQKETKTMNVVSETSLGKHMWRERTT